MCDVRDGGRGKRERERFNMNEIGLVWCYSSFRHSGERGGRGWKGGDESDVVSRGEGHQGEYHHDY